MLDQNTKLLSTLNLKDKSELSLYQIFLPDEQLTELFASIMKARTISKIELVSCGLKFVEINNLLCHLKEHRIAELNLSGNLLSSTLTNGSIDTNKLGQSIGVNKRKFASSY